MPSARQVWQRLGRPGILAAALVTSGAAASTPQAWSEFDAEVLRACVAASALKNPRAAGERVDFDDALGYSALLLAGHYPQPHMKNQSGRELCLFDRRTRTASVSGADGILGGKSPAPRSQGTP
jgi:hypothetical protein